MNRDLAERLAALPALDPQHVVASAVPCKICGIPAPFFDVTDFNKCAGQYFFGPSGVSVPWHRCQWCEFLFTPFFDDWSRAEFARFVYNADYIRVDPDYGGARAALFADEVAARIGGFKDARLLDYGSGAGLFARRMREHGFHTVAEHDPFSSPARPSGTFDIITCFEVIEHAPDPVATLADMAGFLADDGCILLSESLQPDNIHDLRAGWWYCAPRNGHCSTFSAFTLAHLAARAGLAFHGGTLLHALRPAHVRSPIAENIGPRIAAITLAAPAHADECWHGPEGGFRWTAKDAIRWQFPLSDDDYALRIRIPHVMEIEDHFAQRSVVVVDDKDVSFHCAPDALRAVVRHRVTSGQCAATLRTPALVRPTDRGGRDGRALGLAVGIAPAQWRNCAA